MEKIKAKKHLGQNFLIDDNICGIIASFYDIKGKNVLEVGPGKGALTEKLVVSHPQSLHLVEFDKDMVDILEKKKLSGALGVQGIDFQIFQQDILTFTPVFQDYCVIANIPYYITSPILFHFLYSSFPIPEKMLIMMQKEVGEKILEGIEAKKGKIKNSLLSLAIRKKCNVCRVVNAPSISFSPVPKVDSIVVSFEREERYSEIDDTKFINFLKKVFKEPRKTLQNNLQKGGWVREEIRASYSQLHLEEKVRAEELTGEQMMKLYKTLEQIP